MGAKPVVIEIEKWRISIKIMEMASEGHGTRHIADELSLPPNIVYCVKSGKSWNHLRVQK